MQKLVFNIIAITSICTAGVAYSGTMGPIDIEPNWKGFYLGGNVGGWWSQSDSARMNGVVSGVDPVFPDYAINIAAALADVGTNDLSMNAAGFIGGGQVGYNFIHNSKFLIGAEADINGLTQSNNTFTLNKTVNLPPSVTPSESYRSTISVMNKVNCIGTVRGRIGYLFTPSMLVYGKGGFAYGDVSLKTLIIANESLGADIYPGVVAQNNSHQTRPGWTAGGGVEWMFYSNWSANVEYAYYDLGKANSTVTVAQAYGLAIPPVAQYGAASVFTSVPISVGSVHLGINYHFVNL